jgi:hypothetical protein
VLSNSKSTKTLPHSLAVQKIWVCQNTNDSWVPGPKYDWKLETLPPILQAIRDCSPPGSEWFWKRCNEVLDPELSIIILNLQEGQPDNPAMDTHFMINLNTQQIHDKFQDMQSAAPTNCLGDLQTIRNNSIKFD